MKEKFKSFIELYKELGVECLKRKHLVVALLFLLALNPILAYPSKATTSGALFSDEFEGTQVDSTKWIVEENIGLNNYPAYGGSVVVANSQINLKSNGTAFPCITSKNNPFPSTGDFAICFDLNYSSIGCWGNGLWISQGEFIKSDFLTTCNIFQVWADTEATPTSGYVRAYLLGNLIYRSAVYVQNTPTGHSLTVKLEYTDGIYTVFIDGEEIASAPSQLRPDTLGFGHPQCLLLPINPTVLSPSLHWTSLEIGYIRMLHQPKVAIAITELAKIGLRVDINGEVSGPVSEPLADKTVVLSYLIPGYPTWNQISSLTTDSNGFFSASWIPTATGRFTIKARWSGDEVYSSAFEVKNISIQNDGSESFFLAESNSTLSTLAFNSVSKEISFNVEGPSGTTGYVNLLISKKLLPNVDEITLYMDGQKTNCKIVSTGDFWLLNFTYTHSSHDVLVKMQAGEVPEIPVGILLILVLLITSVFMVFFQKKLEKRPLLKFENIG